MAQADTHLIDIADEWQGIDGDDRQFGYVGINDRGGYFFQWHPTEEDMLLSMDPDQTDPPQDWTNDEIRAAEECIAEMYRKEAAKERSWLIPSK